MITRAQAKAMRRVIEAHNGALTDEEVVAAPQMLTAWVTGKAYAAGDRVQYNGTAYRCLQAHTSQDDWTPAAAVSLWAKILIPDPGVIPVWEQPGADNGYSKGDKVHYPGAQDPVYTSLIDNNVWSPDAYPAGWEKVEG